MHTVVTSRPASSRANRNTKPSLLSRLPQAYCIHGEVRHGLLQRSTSFVPAPNMSSTRTRTHGTMAGRKGSTAVALSLPLACSFKRSRSCKSSSTALAIHSSHSPLRQWPFVCNGGGGGWSPFLVVIAVASVLLCICTGVIEPHESDDDDAKCHHATTTAAVVALQQHNYAGNGSTGVVMPPTATAPINCTHNEVDVTVGGREQTRSAKVLLRNKRYVAFPEGSSLSVAFCATIGVFGNPSYLYFSWAINWGLAYDLPNQTWILNAKNYATKQMPQPVVVRRHRRELYGRLETAIDSMGYNGRQCILRALCESTQYFYSQGSNMVEELLRTIFSMPKTKVMPFEHTDLLAYDAAHRHGQSRSVSCPAAYPACGMSLIEMALGEYSKPAAQYMGM